MSINLRKVADSAKPAHQSVIVDDADAGEIWREQVNVVVSKLMEPRRMAVKWRWFAKRIGKTGTLGRGTRAAMLLGPGVKTRDEAIAELIAAPAPN